MEELVLKVKEVGIGYLNGEIFKGVTFNSGSIYRDTHIADDHIGGRLTIL